MHRRVAMSALGRRRLSSPATLRTLPRIDPRAAISDADIDQLNEEGAIVLRGILAPEWIEVLREAAEANLSNPGPLCDEHSAAQGTAGRFHDDQFLWRRHPEFAEYVLRSGAGALAARAMRSSTAHIFYDQLFVKEPGTTAPTPWHNDTSYWHMEGQQICSIWLALDDVRCRPLNAGDEVVGSRCKGAGWAAGHSPRHAPHTARDFSHVHPAQSHSAPCQRALPPTTTTFPALPRPCHPFFRLFRPPPLQVPASRGLSYVKGSHKHPLRHKITNFSGDAHSGVNTYSAGAESFDPLPDVEVASPEASIHTHTHTSPAPRPPPAGPPASTRPPSPPPPLPPRPCGGQTQPRLRPSQVPPLPSPPRRPLTLPETPGWGR